MRELAIEKFLNGGILIFISTKRVHVKLSGEWFSNYFLSPYEINTENITKGNKIKTNGFFFKEYFDIVKYYDFYFTNIEPSRYLLYLHAGKSDKAKSLIVNLHNKRYNNGYLTDIWILNNSDTVLGFGKFLMDLDRNRSGNCIYLPPPSISTTEAIDILLRHYGKEIDKQEYPEWIEKLDLKCKKETDLEIQTVCKEIDRYQSKLNNLKEKRNNIIEISKLLFTKGEQLELIVEQSLNQLGFKIQVHPQGKDKEDMIFTFKDNTLAVIEIHGTENSIERKKLRQIEDWAFYYEETKRKTKEIIILNQCRLKEYPKSMQDRLSLDSHLLEYAQKHDICILPSCVLFEYINNNEKYDINHVEKKLLNTKGVINDLN